MVHITKLFCLASYSVPNIEKLDIDAIDDSSIVIDFEESTNDRINFSLCISPWNDLFPEKVSSINIKYFNLFALHIVIEKGTISCPDSIPKIEDHFIFLHMDKGPFDRRLYSPEMALLLFYQKWTGAKGLIIFPPNKMGKVRFIFANEMRVPPKIDILFEDERYKAIIEKNSSTTYGIFRVVDEHGNTIKEAAKIKSLMLDARLGL